MTGEIGDLVAGKVLPFPVVKRPAPVEKPAPVGAGAGARCPAAESLAVDGKRLVVVDAFNVRAVLSGPMGARRLEVFQHGALICTVDDDEDAMSQAATAVPLVPELRVAFFMGLAAGVRIGNEARMRAEPAS